MDTLTSYEPVERYDHSSSTEVETRDRRVTPITARPAAVVECGSGWYHDAAIKDAKDALAHPYR